MSADLAASLAARMPDLRGRLTPAATLADITWFRVGGPADVLFTPADEADLAYFLKIAPAELPVTTIGASMRSVSMPGSAASSVSRRSRFSR